MDARGNHLGYVIRRHEVTSRAARLILCVFRGLLLLRHHRYYKATCINAQQFIASQLDAAMQLGPTLNTFLRLAIFVVCIETLSWNSQ